MPNEEWGTKRLCPTTGKRFYDLNKNPIISPYTGEEVEVDNSKSRMIAADAEDAVTAKAKKGDKADDESLVDDDDAAPAWHAGGQRFDPARLHQAFCKAKGVARQSLRRSDGSASATAYTNDTHDLTMANDALRSKSLDHPLPTGR